MPKCPACKGKGEYDVQSEVITPKGRYKEDPVTMPCITCEGTGEVSKARLAQMKREQELWCSCDEPDMDNARFYNDGEHPHCSKHCWTCGTCGKITQIG